MQNFALDILVNVAKTKMLLIFISFSSLVFIFIFVSVLVLSTIIQNVSVIFVIVFVVDEATSGKIVSTLKSSRTVVDKLAAHPTVNFVASEAN